MKTPKWLVLVRHGRSVVNDLMHGSPFCRTQEIAAQVLKISNQGCPLTDLGLTQADRVGQDLVDRFGTFDVIIHSGYVRAQQTAEHIAAQTGYDRRMVVDPRFRERDAGYSWGMTRTQFFKSFPWMRTYWKREGWFLARPVGGESMSDVLYNRIRSALQDVMAAYVGQRVLVISHGRAIQTARLFLEGHATNQPHCPIKNLPNCGYVAYAENGAHMLLHGEHP